MSMLIHCQGQGRYANANSDANMPLLLPLSLPLSMQFQLLLPLQLSLPLRMRMIRKMQLPDISSKMSFETTHIDTQNYDNL
jgi:hypothetical protein